MGRCIVFIPEAIREESHKILKEVAEVRIGQHGEYTREELIEELRDVDAVLTTSRYRFTQDVIDEAKKLKMIAKMGSKPDNIDIEAATERGVIVTWTPNTNDDSVAEHAIALMLALSKKLFFMTERLKMGRWRDRTTTVTNELVDKTVGVIGLGSIGCKVAEKLKGFNVKIVCYDPYASQEGAKKVGVKMVDLETLLRESDIVTIHAALTKETRGLIGETELKKMKKSAFIVNTARGPIVDEGALCKALKEEWISGAALDVFETEPPSPRNPLLKLSNVIVTPHIAAWTHESLRRQAFVAAEDVVRLLEGQLPRHILNPEVLKTDTFTDRIAQKSHQDEPV